MIYGFSKLTRILSLGHTCIGHVTEYDGRRLVLFSTHAEVHLGCWKHLNIFAEQVVAIDTDGRKVSDLVKRENDLATPRNNNQQWFRDDKCVL